MLKTLDESKCLIVGIRLRSIIIFLKTLAKSKSRGDGEVRLKGKIKVNWDQAKRMTQISHLKFKR